MRQRTPRLDEPTSPARQAVVYARVSSKEQEKEGFSIPAQLKSLRDYAAAQGLAVAREYVDVETAKQTGRAAFGEMVAYLKAHAAVRVMLVEKTDRLYRNLKDWVTVDELDVEIHFAKEGVVLSRDSRSSEKFMHGIKVLINWLRVSGTTKMPQVDKRICHQLHAIVPLLDELEPQQQPFEFILPREGPLHA